MKLYGRGKTSAFDIPCSIFDILFLLHAWSQSTADIGQTVKNFLFAGFRRSFADKSQLRKIIETFEIRLQHFQFHTQCITTRFDR
jgi:hypothetical protein